MSSSHYHSHNRNRDRNDSSTEATTITATTTTTTTTTLRRKGLLAFLDDAATFYPYDADACKKKLTATVRRRRRRHRRHRTRRDKSNYNNQVDNDGEEEEEEAGLQRDNDASVSCSLTEILALRQPRVVILFFYDAEQTYSVQVRNRIIQVLNAVDCSLKNERSNIGYSNSNDLLCCAVTLGKPQDSFATCSFLRDTGMIATCVDPSSSSSSAAINMAYHGIFLPRIRTHGLPHVMLVRASNGQAFGGTREDIALEWNSPATVRQRWLQEESSGGLDCVQQVLAGLLFPTSCTIL